ncbi:hypothetical protein LJ707_06310 [Mucilaginibacter sp. UR6-1]|uniref:hypothetical protein n=1 Tax=Mucilaginibacter sp. UR6-1 TaxID=1435643 RepID=UPI001E5453C3|nr:hypothetical protein [Mucilaginibacter sp. UR6-1]MCC8408536.1 hypothetical protein [Mucilaginibacter sp. UR6-1]
MIFKKLLIVFVLFVSGPTLKAQTCTLKFSVVDTANNSIQDYNIKISGNVSKVIYLFSSINSANYYLKDIKTKAEDDSLHIAVSHVSYQDTVVKVPITKTINVGAIKLHLKNYSLNQVQVKGPSVWQQGDTTNYRADDFKEGDEKKLKDVLKSLPGFTVKDDGSLLFRNKRVGKIFIDGQEIFADNISLLLNSFPSGVIELVQAQENQNNNRLLKKIGGTETSINLTLKKGTFKAAFGDFEAGAGQKGRYKVTPVIFSISKQIKGGYIGNINSLGEGIGWSMLRNIKGGQEYEAERLLSPDQTPDPVKNLPERYYLKNRLFDNRLDLSTKLSDKLLLKTTITSIFDRQTQGTASSFNYFTGSVYSTRSESKYIEFKPSIFNFGQVYDYGINDNNTLQFKINLFVDRSKSVSSSKFDENNIAQAINGAINKNWYSPTLQVTHTHLTADNKAVVTSFSFNRQWIQENGMFYSKQWPQIFAIPDSLYNNLSQLPRHSTNNWKLQQSRFFKFRKWSVNTLFSITHSQLRLAPNLIVNDSLNSNASIAPAFVNNSGTYKSSSVTGQLNGRYKYSNKRQLSYRITFGLNRLQRTEALSARTNFYPEFNMILSGATNFLKELNDYLTISYDYVPPQVYELFSINLPQLPSLIRRNAANRPGIKSFTANYSFSLLKKQDLSSLNINTFYTRYFNSPVFAVGYNNFLPIITDSVVNDGRNEYGLSGNFKVPSLALMAVIEMDAGFSSASYFFTSNTRIAQGTNYQLSFKTSLKKSWHKMYYITLSGTYSETINRSRGIATASLQYNRFGTLIGAVKQRLVYSKNFSAIFNVQFANTGLYADRQKGSFLLLDSELNYKFKATSPVTITLIGENLTDQRYYNIASNGVASQLVSAIPLIGRNFFVSAKFVF